ncbi:putative oxidoreductase, nitronate monooxygenase family [Mycolicibacterium hippocampi]|uniref:Putative oxidoreductase, nitronate monooxygenase family n=1 Tax=Mycolicibacterium hippocampi TaxID=659824 RepID=A0A850PXR3_9MYCO|nr:putative oxidoreductase, nitronate monooxygenase family [Mycolicibacterium hippocampi]
MNILAVVTSNICTDFGIDFPLFAFSHCRDVVAAVTNAGGFGVLGATAYTPAQLDQELAWIDDAVGGKPYGVDLIVPAKFEGKGEKLSSSDLAERIPQGYRDLVDELLAAHGIEPEPGRRLGSALLSGNTGRELLDVALTHPVKLIANALGVPPDYMIEAGKERGIPVAALVGAKEHAVKQVAAGVDLIVAQGTEAGGHCGEVSTLVVVPEVLEAIDEMGASTPVLAAGGIVTGRQMAGMVAMGAAGAWTGSVWLTTEEAETAPHTVAKMLAASSRDTVRSAGRTGKPSRQLVSDWTNAWTPNAGGHQPLPLPLQSMLCEPVIRRIDVLASQGHEGAQALATYFVGQGVGLMNKVKPAREVVREFIEDYLAAAERLNSSLPG